jgi:hypothetical protein
VPHFTETVAHLASNHFLSVAIEIKILRWKRVARETSSMVGALAKVYSSQRAEALALCGRKVIVCFKVELKGVLHSVNELKLVT